jgi:type II secretory pathway pseudopilin PulG
MRAFTLIETLTVIALFTLIIGAVAGSIVMLYRVQGYTFQQSQAIGEARRGIEEMTKTIREGITGEDGSYLIEKAEDYEFVFFSDIDKDSQVERVRYVMNPAGGGSGSETKTCVSFTKGGSCTALFSGFLLGDIESATLQVDVEGDLDGNSETVLVAADAASLATLCDPGSGCGQCATAYQDTQSFDVTQQAADDSLLVVADSSNPVDPICNWQDPNHSVKARFVFSWQEQAQEAATAVFRRGITNATGWPPAYTEQEILSVVSENVRNEVRELPVFTYYDADNNVLLDPQDRLNKTARVHIELIINVNPAKEPGDFSVETDVQMRNLKTNL